MADTAALVVALSAQISQFEKDMAKAADAAEKGVNTIEDKFKKANISAPFEDLEKKIKGFAAGGIIGLIIKETVEKITELNKEVAKIADTAELVGASSDDIQKLRFAFISTGGAAESADSALETFGRKAADAAKGTGDLYNFLRANNIEAREFARLPITEQMSRLADLIKNASTQQERLSIAATATNRRLGPELVQALQGGSAALKTFGDELERSGGLIPESTVQRAKEANIEFNKMKALIEGFAQIAAVEAFTALSEAIHSVASGISEVINNIEFLKRLKEAAGNALGIVPGFDYNQDPKTRVTIPGGGTKQFNEQDEALKKLLQTQQKRNEVLVTEAQTIGLSAGAQAELKTEVELQNQALEKNIPLTDATTKKIYDMAVAAGKAAQQLDDAKRQWAGLNSAAQFAGDQMVNVLDGLINKTTTWADALKNVQQAIIKALLQASILGSGPLAGILGTAPATAGGTGGLIGAIAGLAGKQSGGPVSGGSAYVVGEHGPEVFVPNSSGQIVPNGINRGVGGGTSVQINNYVAADTETKQTTQQGPDGERIIIDIVKKAQARGELDDTNRSRFGLRAAKVR